MGLFSLTQELAIDLGTANTLIIHNGKVVVDEPSIVALDVHTGKLVAIKVVTDENDLMIINKSGITIRLKVADVRIMGRATQGVRLINLEKRNDHISSVCKVQTEDEEEIPADETLEESVETTDNAAENASVKEQPQAPASLFDGLEDNDSDN